MPDRSATIEDLLLKLRQYNSDFLAANEKGWCTEEELVECFKISIDAYKTYTSILIKLSKAAQITVQSTTAQETLDDIRKKRPIQILRTFVELNSVLTEDDYKTVPNRYLFKHLGNQPSIASTFQDMLADDFHMSFDIGNYYINRTEILALPHDLSSFDKFAAYFQEIRESFAFEQYIAAAVLCRSLLEHVLRTLLTNKQRVTKSSKRISIKKLRDFSYGILLDIAQENELLASSYDDLFDIKESCDSLVHADAVVDRISRYECLRLIQLTIASVETLVIANSSLITRG